MYIVHDICIIVYVLCDKIVLSFRTKTASDKHSKTLVRLNRLSTHFDLSSSRVSNRIFLNYFHIEIYST